MLHRLLNASRSISMKISRRTLPCSGVKRRRFIGMLFVFMGYSLFLKTQAITALAQFRRLLVPDTDLGNLLYEDPADLDIRNLPVTEPGKLGVSGTDDHVADMDTWRFKLAGLVQNPRRFSYTEILNLPRLERKVLLICPGTFAFVAQWRGFSLWDLLQQHGLSAEATHVNIKGPPEKYRKVVRFRLDEIQNNNVFLAFEVNGQKLPLKHGYPLRAVAEFHVGAKWAKYVYEVEAVHREEQTPEKTHTEGSAFFP